MLTSLRKLVHVPVALGAAPDELRCRRAERELVALAPHDVPVDRVVEVDAHAAVDVQRRVRDVVATLGRPELRRRDFERIVAALVEVRGRLQHRELDRLIVDVAVGHALADGLEGPDRAVELLALRRVVRRQAQRLVGDTGDHGAGRDRRAIEHEREDLVALLG